MIKVTSRATQGDHLSPLLFNLFINDIGHSFHYYKFLLFSDDLKLYISVLSIDDCTKLQHDLNNFQIWCMNNGLNININKCSQITFTRHNKNIISQYYINNCKLNIVTTVKDLGITFSKDLTFTEHINVT